MSFQTVPQRRSRPAGWLLAAAVLSGCSASVPAEEPVTYAGEALDEVRSWKDLPAAVQEALHARAGGLQGLADRDEEFNSSDVVRHPVKPGRRFDIAGVGRSRVLVAQEQGGIAYRIEATLFRLDAEGATMAGQWRIPSAPKDLADLVRQVEAVAPDR